MFTKIALATALMLGSASLASAQNFENYGPLSGTSTSGPVVQDTNPMAAYARTGHPRKAVPNAQKNWLGRASQDVDGGS